MAFLSHWMYPIAGVYAMLGIIFFRLSRRPTCRVCLFRAKCPNRPLAGPPACAKNK